MRPNPTRQINRLKGCVSWVKDYYCISEIVDWPNDSVQRLFNCFILITDEDKIIPAVFCDGQQFWSAVHCINRQFSRQKASPYWLIVTSTVSRKEIESFFLKRKVNIIPVFLDPATELSYNELFLESVRGLTKNTLWR